MAVRLYANEYVKKELLQRGCSKVKQYETAALWMTPRGYYFTVPEEGDDKRCDEYTFREILLEIEGH